MNHSNNSNNLRISGNGIRPQKSACSTTPGVFQRQTVASNSSALSMKLTSNLLMHAGLSPIAESPSGSISAGSLIPAASTGYVEPSGSTEPSASTASLSILSILTDLNELDDFGNGNLGTVLNNLAPMVLGTGASEVQSEVEVNHRALKVTDENKINFEKSAVNNDNNQNSNSLMSKQTQTSKAFSTLNASPSTENLEGKNLSSSTSCFSTTHVTSSSYTSTGDLEVKSGTSTRVFSNPTSTQNLEVKTSSTTSCFSTTLETQESSQLAGNTGVKEVSCHTQVYSTKELVSIMKLIRDACWKQSKGISIIIELSALCSIFGPGKFGYYMRCFNAALSNISERRKKLLDKSLKHHHHAQDAAAYVKEITKYYKRYRKLRSQQKKQATQEKQAPVQRPKVIHPQPRTFDAPFTAIQAPLSQDEETVPRPVASPVHEIELCPRIQAKINANRLLREQADQSKQFPAVHEMYTSILKKEEKRNEHIIKAFNSCKLKDIPEDLKIAYGEYTMFCVFRTTSPLPITTFKSKEEVFQELVRIQGPPPPPPPVMLSSVVSTNEQKQEEKEEPADLNELYYGPINEEQKEAEIAALVQPRRETTPDSDESSYGRDIEEPEDEKDDEDIDMTESSMFNGAYLQYYEYCLNNSMVPKTRNEFTTAAQIDQEYNVIKSRKEAEQNIFHSVYQNYYSYGVSNGIVPKVSCEFKTAEEIQQEHAKVKAYIEQKTKVPSIIQAEAEPKEDKKDDPDDSGTMVACNDFISFPEFPSHLLYPPAERQRQVQTILVDSWAFRKFPTDVIRYIVVLLIQMEGNDNLICFSHQLVKQVCPKLAVYITVAHHKFKEDTGFHHKWYELIYKVNNLMKARAVWWKKQKVAEHDKVFKIIHKDWSSMKDIHDYMLQLISAADFQAYIRRYIRQHQADDFSKLTEQEVHSIFFRLTMVNYPEFLRLLRIVQSIRLPENWVELHSDLFPNQGTRLAVQRDPTYEIFQNVLITAMGRYCSNYRYYEYTARGIKTLGKGEKDPENKNWKFKFGRLDYRYFRTLNQTLLQYISILRQLIEIYGQPVRPMKAAAEPKDDVDDKQDPPADAIKIPSPLPSPSRFDVEVTPPVMTIDDVRMERLKEYYYNERMEKTTRRSNYSRKYPHTNQELQLLKNLQEEKEEPTTIISPEPKPTPKPAPLEDFKLTLVGGMHRRETSVASSAWSPIPWSVSPQPPTVPPPSLRTQPVINLISPSPTPRLKRKSRKIRHDPYAPHRNPEQRDPLQGRVHIPESLISSSSVDISLPQALQPVQEDVVVPSPVYERSNVRTLRSGADMDYASFNQDTGQVQPIIHQPRGRPRMDPSQHKYQKKYDHRGRPKQYKKVSLDQAGATGTNYRPDAFLRGYDNLNDTVDFPNVSPPRRPDNYVRVGRPRNRPILGIIREPNLMALQEMKEAAEEEFDPFAEEKGPGTVITYETPQLELGQVFKRKKWKPDVRIGRRLYNKRIRELQEQLALRDERIANANEAQRIMHQGRQMNSPLASQLIKASKKTIPITKDQALRYTTLLFNFNQAGLREAANGYRQIFEEQTRGLDRYVENVIGEQIIAWRIAVHYDGPNGIHTVSTTWCGSYATAFNNIQHMLMLLFAKYGGEDEIYIHQFEVRARTNRQQLFGGITLAQIKERLDKIREEWCIINPNSKTNCLWTSVAIADGYRNNHSLIHCHKAQNRAGWNLKQRVGTRNWRGGCEEDVKKLAHWKQKTIEVYNDFIELLGTFHPDNYNPEQPLPTLRLLLLQGHYHAMLPKDDEVVQEYYKEIKETEPRTIAPIKPLDKEFTERRIVAYDLESWRNPVEKEKKLPNGDIRLDAEVHQEAYACGWAFEIMAKDIDELEHCKEKGYSIYVYEFMETTKIMAYKRILGETCLDEALEHWMYDPMFHDAVFYAHNGGKFDIRLILGQSNLMYKEAYVINPDRTIELNSRIINMDVSNHEQEYTKLNKKGEEYKVYHTISIRDSLPLFGPGNGLDKLSEELNVPHKKLKELVNVHDLMYEDTWRLYWELYDMEKYFLNDVLGLLEVMIQFNEVAIKQTGIPITAVNTGASLAKKYFLKHYYHCYIPETTQHDPQTTIYTLNQTVDEFIRDGYGGGRCEAFVSKEINQPIYYYDFTSLYPDVARNPLPTGQPRWVADPSLPRSETFRTVHYVWSERIERRQMSQKVAFWKVKVRSPAALAGQPMDPFHRKPLFGIKEEDMYVFRWYKEWTEMVIYEPELLLAIDLMLDYEFEPLNAILFEHHESLKPCMEKLFLNKAEATEKNQPALAKTWKIILNSLYGVWGLKVNSREGIEISRPEKSNWAIDMVTEKLMDIDKVGRYVITRRLKDLEVKDCNVAVAAAITSYARMKLYQLFMDIQDAGETLLYCDTDSVITTCCIEQNPALSAKWIGETHGKALGSLKNEIVECIEKYNSKHKDAPLPPKLNFDEAVIVAPKLYIVCAEQQKITKKAHKGYKENKEKQDLVTYERMKRLIDPSIDPSERYMVQTTVQWLGGNGDIVRNNIGVRLVERTKYTHQTINKGILESTGHVVPFTDAASTYQS